ncbi:MAG: cupin domain-containing protein [Gammaproteobacteria bacterium]|nr:cupin domain-containing protein [Gammaproteobacteria bacterium]
MNEVAARNEYYERLAPSNLAPLWEVLSKLVTREPVTESVPCHWRYDEIRPLVLEAGGLIRAEEAERRVLILQNPGLGERVGATETLFAGLQMILPNEVAPAHRHTPSALRFIVEGDGKAFTSVDGERAYMQVGDLVLTPNWAWHDHGHEGDVPMVWLDGLDIPLLRQLGPVFVEHYPRAQFPSNRAPGSTTALYGQNMRPVDDSFEQPHSPMFHYPYAQARAALDALAGSTDPDPRRGWCMEYIDPTRGGPIMPTLSAFLSLLPAGFAGRVRQTTEGQVFSCVEGTGRTVIDPDGKEPIVFEWGPRDHFVIPTWVPYRHEIDEQAVVFNYSDAGVQKLLGLYREQ